MTATGPAGLDWRRALGLWLAWNGAGHLAWEAAHMPLYTVAREEPLWRVVAYGLHCTLGDLLIALSALVLALLLFGASDWPRRAFGRVATAAVVIGAAYTAGSEWVNTRILDSWAYTDAMPLVPVLGIGWTPVLQWLAVPGLALVAIGRRRAASAATKRVRTAG